MSIENKITKVPYLDLQRNIRPLKKEILDAIEGVIDSGAFVLGEKVTSFEKHYADFCKVKYSIGVSSGTGSLKLALAALDIGIGDEVIIPANTFIATAEAVSHVGATPILVDARADTQLIDFDKISEKITSKTKAIIPVHLFGQIADMNEVIEIAEANNLFVVEDASQSHGATYNGKGAGSIGDIGCFSFYPGKNLGAFGEAGACTTNSKEYADKIALLRNHGVTDKYIHSVIGYNDKMHGIQGAVLDIKLSHLHEWNKKRGEAALHYRNLLSANKKIKIVEAGKNRTHVYHVFVIEVDNRDSVKNELEKVGIGTNIHYPVAIHLQEAYHHLGLKKGDFPVVEKASSRILSIPMFPEITKEEIEYVCMHLNRIVV